jgi:hypothetical protein
MKGKLSEKCLDPSIRSAVDITSRLSARLVVLQLPMMSWPTSIAAISLSYRAKSITKPCRFLETSFFSQYSLVSHLSQFEIAQPRDLLQTTAPYFMEMHHDEHAKAIPLGCNRATPAAEAAARSGTPRGTRADER